MPSSKPVILGLLPGMMAGFVLVGQEAEVTVPADEAFGIGTFTVKIPAPDFDSGPVVRDGGLEAVGSPT